MTAPEITSALLRAEHQVNAQSWENERDAHRIMRRAELNGDRFVVLTGAENTALLTWIQRVEQS